MPPDLLVLASGSSESSLTAGRPPPGSFRDACTQVMLIQPAAGRSQLKLQNCSDFSVGAARHAGANLPDPLLQCPMPPGQLWHALCGVCMEQCCSAGACLCELFNIVCYVGLLSCALKASLLQLPHLMSNSASWPYLESARQAWFMSWFREDCVCCNALLAQALLTH